MYQALYRKYRPVNFDEVVGQDIVIRTLKNALNSNKTSHAYMFSGPRGVGKTSIAKILAKTINCLNLENGNACGHCANCETIQSNLTTDIIEIDAASNNGVDEIREIRNKINLVPSELRYKVYIIDEVHMLSVGAFNALLKTLEEPPGHVIFILATTDPHKVPITIISRCQCFEFKRISEQEIVNKLKQIVDIEKIKINDDVLEKIAKISEGGMRDSLGLLDKVSSFSDSVINMDDFNKIAGIVGNDTKIDFISAVYEKNFIKIIDYVKEIYESGKDFVVFSQDLMDELRNYLLEYYLENVEKYPLDFILSFIDKLDKMLIDLKISNNIRIMFESGILTFANSDCSHVNNRVDKKEEKNISREINPGPIVENDSNTEQNELKDSQNVVLSKPNVEDDILKRKEQNSRRFLIVNNTFATAQKQYLISLKEKWNKLNDFVLDKSYGGAACYLVDSNLRAVGEKELIITCNYESVLERGLNLIPIMEELLFNLTNVRYKIAILTNQEWENERSKFIDLKNKGECYVYQNLDKEIDNNVEVDKDSTDLNDNNIDLVQQAISIFGKDAVKIN